MKPLRNNLLLWIVLGVLNAIFIGVNADRGQWYAAFSDFGWMLVCAHFGLETYDISSQPQNKDKE